MKIVIVLVLLFYSCSYHLIRSNQKNKFFLYKVENNTDLAQLDFVLYKQLRNKLINRSYEPIKDDSLADITISCRLESYNLSKRAYVKNKGNEKNNTFRTLVYRLNLNVSFQLKHQKRVLLSQKISTGVDFEEYLDVKRNIFQAGKKACTFIANKIISKIIYHTDVEGKNDK